MSNSNPISNDRSQALDAAIRKYYSQIEAGIEVDRQAFVRQYPGLESEINDFFSNVGLLEDGDSLDASRQNLSFSDITRLLSRRQLPTTSNAKPPDASAGNAIMVRDYQILECIGKGGMGCVYRALNVHLQMQVALKTIRVERATSSEAIQRFTREMRILAKLEHPNIVRVFDAGEHQSTHYFVMELVAGIDLRKLIDRIGPLPMPEASKIIGLAAEALQYAHDQKVLHRDVKPANIMLTAMGSVKLLDLGLAQAFEMQLEDQISRADQAVGTLAYMAPEQLVSSHQCSNQSDIYSLGVSLHEILSGSRSCQQPGGLPTFADVRSMRPDLNEKLCRLLDEMLSSSPSERPKSMAEVAARLSKFNQNADLPGLVTEYYQWRKRGTLTPTPPPVHDDTEVRWAGKTEPNNLALNPSTGEPKPTGSFRMPKRWRTPASFLAGAATVACIALLFPSKPQGDSVIETNSSSQRPVIQPGVLEILSDTDEELVRSIITNGNLKVRRVEEGDENAEIFSVSEGPNSLRAGNYELLIPGPVDFVPIPFQITSSANTKLLPTPSPKTFFQFPVIPGAGNIASFHGSVWLATWPIKTKTTYDLTLEVLAVDEQVVPRTKWLKVEVRSTLDSGTYQEIGYLQIDSDEWENSRLTILYGWIEASGESIKQLVSDRLGTTDSDSLVVKFDPKVDHLKEISFFTLPVGRVSVHDILVLFFGDNHIAAADETILKLRPSLSESEKRNVWLEHHLLDSRMVECYVVASSRSHDEASTAPWWRIARSRENPFEIVQLEVDTDFLTAVCTTTASRTESIPRDDLQQTLEELSSRAIDPATFPKPYPFDLAEIPDEPCSVTVDGEITRERLPEVIRFTASMLGTEQREGRTLHWLELDITSDPTGAAHREICRFLVDASDFPGTLQIEEGWLAYDNGTTVLPLPSGNQLEWIINARLQLSPNPHFQRTGVVDLMWMLFKSDFTPSSKLADLRRQIDSLVKDRIGKPEKLSSKHAGPLPCVRYEPLGGEPGLVSYKLYRCKQIPFGFAKITLSYPGTINIHLTQDGFQALTEPFKTSPLGSKENLANLERATLEKLSARAKINWRVWSWKDSGKEYKVWAEFGGVVESTKPARKDVLLWKEPGNERRIPYALFDAADKLWIDKGRFWQTGNEFKQFEFKGTNSKGLLVFGSRNIEPFKQESLQALDSQWVTRHKTSKVNAIQGEWDSFAPYVVSNQALVQPFQIKW